MDYKSQDRTDQVLTSPCNGLYSIVKYTAWVNLWWGLKLPPLRKPRCSTCSPFRAARVELNPVLQPSIQVDILCRSVLSNVHVPTVVLVSTWGGTPSTLYHIVTKLALDNVRFGITRNSVGNGKRAKGEKVSLSPLKPAAKLHAAGTSSFTAIFTQFCSPCCIPEQHHLTAGESCFYAVQ